MLTEQQILSALNTLVQQNNKYHIVNSNSDKLDLKESLERVFQRANIVMRKKRRA